MQILDGTLVSAHIKEKIKEDAAHWVKAGGKRPHLAAILVGNNPASEAYIGSKVRTCEELGFDSTMLNYDADVTEKQLISDINDLNKNPEIDGILVQLPLPAHISGEQVINAIDPGKDVDGFHPVSLGKMLLGHPTFLPATPYGILLMLEDYKIEVAGMHVVIIGRSNIVGTPMSVLLSRNGPRGNATVTLTHSRTKNLKDMCLMADMIIAAIGQPKFVTADMVRPGAVVIDVGINRVHDESRKSGYRLVGDVDYDNVAPLCSYITPVPKGVGPMTICGLMKNTLEAAKKNRQHSR